MTPSSPQISSVLAGADLVYFDGRLADSAILLANEVRDAELLKWASAQVPSQPGDLEA
jgi:hypothetical protein